MSTPASGHLARLPLPAPLLALLLLALLLGGCVQDEAVVSVGPVSFTESELLGLGEAQRYHLGLLAAVGLAVASGDEAVMGGPVLEYRRAGRLAERLREEVILEAAGVTEEELEARYLTDPDHELVVRHLVVLSERWRPEEERSRARGRAAAALARVEGGEPFEAVVGEVSEEPGAARREGLLQPGREGTWVREFWEAASALEEGERSPVVETEYGFHVLRLEERRLLPFEEARDRVVGEVARLLGGGAAWEAWLEERRAGVVLDPDAIAAFDPADPTEGVALAIVAGGCAGHRSGRTAPPGPPGTGVRGLPPGGIRDPGGADPGAGPPHPPGTGSPGPIPPPPPHHRGGAAAGVGAGRDGVERLPGVPPGHASRGGGGDGPGRPAGHRAERPHRPGGDPVVGSSHRGLDPHRPGSGGLIPGGPQEPQKRQLLFLVGFTVYFGLIWLPLGDPRGLSR
jgi:hypothetical protein